MVCFLNTLGRIKVKISVNWHKYIYGCSCIVCIISTRILFSSFALSSLFIIWITISNFVSSASESCMITQVSNVCRSHFVCELRQWETALQCKAISYWLGPYAVWFLNLCHHSQNVWELIFRFRKKLSNTMLITLWECCAALNSTFTVQAIMSVLHILLPQEITISHYMLCFVLQKTSFDSVKNYGCHKNGKEEFCCFQGKMYLSHLMAGKVMLMTFFL